MIWGDPFYANYLFKKRNMCVNIRGMEVAKNAKIVRRCYWAYGMENGAGPDKGSQGIHAQAAE